MIVESIIAILAFSAAADTVHRATNKSSKEKQEKLLQKKFVQKQKKLNEEIKRKNKELKAYGDALHSSRKKR
jgi:malate synthase